MSIVTLGSTSARQHYLFAPLLLVTVLVGAIALRSPGLFTSSGLAGAVIVVAPLIVAALALTPIALVGRGGVDLSVGPLLGFINVSLVAWLVQGGITNPLIVFLYVILAGVAYQLVVATIIIFVRVAPIIVTLSGFLTLNGINLTIMDRPSGSAPDWMFDWGYGAELLSPVLLILLAVVALWFALTRTTLYRQIVLTGADERMAYASGVNTVAARYWAHSIAGALTGVAALLYTALIASGDPTQGSTYTLAAITALVLGGTSLAGGLGGGAGSILGAISMYLISYLLATFSFGNVAGFVTQLATGTVLVLALVANNLLNRRDKR